MAEDSGSGMMMMVVVAVIAFAAFFFLRKQGASSDMQAAASQPSSTYVQPQTTIVQSPPQVIQVIYVEDDPDFGFPDRPCHRWEGSIFDPDRRRCYFPFHRDCDDRGQVWDADRDQCINPPTRDVDIHRPTTINININEVAKKGGRIVNNITAKGSTGGGTTNVNVNTTPSSTWHFRLNNGKDIGPDTVATFTSNCHSALGKNDPSCQQVRGMCSTGTASNKDVCTALQDAGFA